MIFSHVFVVWLQWNELSKWSLVQMLLLNAVLLSSPQDMAYGNHGDRDEYEELLR